MAELVMMTRTGERRTRKKNVEEACSGLLRIQGGAEYELETRPGPSSQAQTPLTGHTQQCTE